MTPAPSSPSRIRKHAPDPGTAQTAGSARTAHPCPQPSPRSTPRRPERPGRLVPGLAIAATAVVLAIGLHQLAPFVGTLVWAVLLGAIMVNLPGRPGLGPATRPGLSYASKRVLRLGVVGLGLQLALGDILGLGPGVLLAVVISVLVTFFGTWWLGSRLGVRRGTSLLVATGFSICGASAIAAMDAVSESDEEDVATGLAMVTLFGSSAILVLPLLGGALGLGAEAYGIWVGSSVQEVAQVVAAAGAVPGAVGLAVAVKLTRILTLAPMVAIAGVARRRDASGGNSSGSAARPAIVPLFVIGFLTAMMIRSTGLVPETVLAAAKQIDAVLLAAAMFALGTGVDIGTLRRTGPRPLLLGAISWVLISIVAYVGVVLAC